jgi:hypothetical protein
MTIQLALRKMKTPSKNCPKKKLKSNAANKLPLPLR